MNSFFNFRPVQSAATSSAAAPRFAPAPTARTAVLALLTLLGAASWASPAQAQQPEPVQVTQLDAQSMLIRFKNPAQDKWRLQIMRLESGQCLVNEAYRTPAYGHVFDFNNVPAGKYALSLRVGPARYRYTVQVQTQAQHTSIAIYKGKSRVQPAENTPATAAL